MLFVSFNKQWSGEWLFYEMIFKFTFIFGADFESWSMKKKKSGIIYTHSSPLLFFIQIIYL